ncbi:MAG: 2-phospho-L-lactate guanylyltransferase, partial [Chloroflexi bacterium]|nr:2-phospho-L-lactate guanylyltransferase [Chloroflexota bacterium]
VVVVPDHLGDGTNALLVSPPRAIDFAFGPGSRGRHVAAARAAGAVLVELGGPLALDVDTPEDLAAAPEMEAVADAAAAGAEPPGQP